MFRVQGFAEVEGHVPGLGFKGLSLGGAVSMCVPGSSHAGFEPSTLELSGARVTS